MFWNDCLPERCGCSRTAYNGTWRTVASAKLPGTRADAFSILFVPDGQLACSATGATGLAAHHSTGTVKEAGEPWARRLLTLLNKGGVVNETKEYAFKALFKSSSFLNLSNGLEREPLELARMDNNCSQPASRQSHTCWSPMPAYSK